MDSEMEEMGVNYSPEQNLGKCTKRQLRYDLSSLLEYYWSNSHVGHEVMRSCLCVVFVRKYLLASLCFPLFQEKCF